MVTISEAQNQEDIVKPAINDLNVSVYSYSSKRKMNVEGIVSALDNFQEKNEEEEEEVNDEESSDEIDLRNDAMEENGDNGDSDSDDSENAGQQIKPSGMDIVKNVLERAAQEAEAISVAKPLDLDYDLGTLLAVDTNELDDDLLRDSTEEYLKTLARDNTQLLVNHIWELPITRMENEIVAKLPSPSFKLPREKPVPKARPLTKWQQFAVEKGIQKKRRPKAQWDETLQKWIPWWGYQRAKADREKNWVIETKKNDDPMADPFAKRAGEKQERVAKNEVQRMKNLAKANNVKIPRDDKLGKEKEKQKLKKKDGPVPRMGLLTPDKMDSTQLKRALAVSKFSTASVGKFQNLLPREKERSVGALLPIAKKRRAPYLKPEEERKANLDIIDSILKKRPKLDLEKAVNRHINQEETQRAEEKSQKPKGKGRRKAGGGGKGNRKRKGLGKGKMSGKASKGGGKQKGGKKKR